MTSGVDTFVHRFVPAHTSDAPTLVLLHGTGGDENDLIELGQALDGQAALLSPRGQVSEQGANRWFRRLGEGIFDTDDLLARTDQLAEFITVAATHYQLDPTRLVAVGFSNGANIGGMLLLRHPQLLRGAILFAAMVPLEQPGRIDLSQVGVFLASGRADPIAPPDQAERLAELLIDRNAAVELRWHAGGHSIDQHTLAQATTWLGKLGAITNTDLLP